MPAVAFVETALAILSPAGPTPIMYMPSDRPNATWLAQVVESSQSTSTPTDTR